MNNYDPYDATDLAKMVHDKEISPEELLQEAKTKIETLNPKINAVVTPMFEYAADQISSGLPDGPFRGVPMLLKDLLATVKDVPYSMGCKGLKKYKPSADSELVRRFKAAGFVLAGKTNTPEFGLMGTTEPEAWGPTRNPWNLEKSTGGSSGGSAAAIAAGMVPVASAGDGGGSIRIPAAWCGLFGIKPSRGRTPTAPHGEHWQGAATEHVLSRSVRDSAKILDLIAGDAPGAPYEQRRPQTSWLQELDQDPKSLRIAFSTKSPLGAAVAPECVKAVTETAKLLEEMGHIVEEQEPAIDGERLAKSYLTMYFGEVAAEIARLEPKLGRPARRTDVEDATWALGLVGRRQTSEEFILNLDFWNEAARTMGSFHESWDLYMTPTTAAPPATLGTMPATATENALIKVIDSLHLGALLEASGVLQKAALRSLEKLPFTQLGNLTGQPAMSVPLHWTKDMLPIGVQFMAPMCEESRLFALAGQLERAKPWKDMHPPIE